MGAAPADCRTHLGHGAGDHCVVLHGAEVHVGAIRHRAGPDDGFAVHLGCIRGSHRTPRRVGHGRAQAAPDSRRRSTAHPRSWRLGGAGHSLGLRRSRCRGRLCRRARPGQRHLPFPFVLLRAGDRSGLGPRGARSLHGLRRRGHRRPGCRQRGRFQGHSGRWLRCHLHQWRRALGRQRRVLYAGVVPGGRQRWWQWSRVRHQPTVLGQDETVLADLYISHSAEQGIEEVHALFQKQAAGQLDVSQRVGIYSESLAALSVFRNDMGTLSSVGTDAPHLCARVGRSLALGGCPGLAGFEPGAIPGLYGAVVLPPRPA